MDLEERDAYIENRKADIAALESLISESREGFNNHKAQRDKLQDERKYIFFLFSFWFSLRLPLNCLLMSKLFIYAGHCGEKKVHLLLKLIS